MPTRRQNTLRSIVRSVAEIVTGVAAGKCAGVFLQRLQFALMGEVEYTNLRLSFEQRGERDYEVTAAIEGEATTTSMFTIPMSDEALQAAIRELSETRRRWLSQRPARSPR